MGQEVNAETIIRKVKELTDDDKVLWNVTSDQDKYVLSLNRGRIVASMDYANDQFDHISNIYKIDFSDNLGQSIANVVDVVNESELPKSNYLAKSLYDSIKGQIERLNNKKLGFLYEDLITRS